MSSKEELLKELQGIELLEAIEAAEQPGFFAPEGTGGQAARSLVGGLTLGFQEEISAGLETAMGRGPFSEALEREEATSSEIPGGIRAAGAIAGGVATGVGLAKLFPAAFSTIPRAAGAAAAEGAVSGFGFSAEDRLQGAVMGLITGGVLGAVLPSTLNGLAKVWQSASARFAQPTRQAGALILREVQNGQISLNQAKARLAKLGREAVLADIPELRGLAERVAQSGGIGARRAQRILNARAKKAGDRIVNDAGEILGNRRQFQETLDQLIEERAALSGPLYEKAYASTINLTDELQDAGSRIGQIAPTILRRAERSLAAELGQTIDDVRLSTVARDGSVEFSSAPSVQYWDLVKRELDDMIGKAVRAGQKNRVRQLSNINKKIIESLDNQTGNAYADARNAFSGAIRLQEALDGGRNFIRGDADEIISGIKQMTDGEREMFRIGIVKGVQDITEARTLTSDQTRRIFDTARNNRIFKEVFPNQRSLNKFKSVILREKEFTETNRILQGSQTFRRQAAAEDQNRQTIETARDLLTRGGEGRAGFIRRLLEQSGRQRSLSPETGAELGRSLFTQGPENIESILRQLDVQAPAASGARAIGAGLAQGAVSGVVPKR